MLINWDACSRPVIFRIFCQHLVSAYTKLPWPFGCCIVSVARLNRQKSVWTPRLATMHIFFTRSIKLFCYHEETDE